MRLRTAVNIYLKRRTQWECFAILGYLHEATMEEAELAALSRLQSSSVTMTKIVERDSGRELKRYGKTDLPRLSKIRRLVESGL